MPIYEFHCTDCDTSFETLVRPGHGEDVACPTCNGSRLRRDLSVFASARGGLAEAAPLGATPMRGSGGGCCGGGCGCH